MNIYVKTFSGHVVVRPDTGWVRKNEDFYVPDHIDSISASTVVTARICRPGKCIGLRFVERYYDFVGDGLLLYPDTLLDGTEEGYANAIALGHISYVPLPEREKSSMSAPLRSLLSQAIVDITSFCLVRSGDIVTVETEPRKYLCAREDQRCSVRSGDFAFDVIF